MTDIQTFPQSDKSSQTLVLFVLVVQAIFHSPPAEQQNRVCQWHVPESGEVIQHRRQLVEGSFGSGGLHVQLVGRLRRRQGGGGGEVAMARQRGRRVVSLVVVRQGAGRRRGGGETGHRRRDRHPAALAQPVDHRRLPRHLGRLQRDCSGTDDGRSVRFWNPAQVLWRAWVAFSIEYTRWKRQEMVGWLGSSGRDEREEWIWIACMYVSG
jgi:hypothetical protein